MENIIEKLYALHLDTDSTTLGIPNKESLDAEWKLYDFLYENLADECKKSFSQYANLRNERAEEECKSAYKAGFKTALRLILESVKE